jgi:hypothetical protein
MHGMLIAAAVAKDHPVAPALPYMQWIDLRPRLIVDRPRIELRSVHRSDVAKGEGESFIRLGRLCRTGEL